MKGKDERTKKTEQAIAEVKKIWKDEKNINFSLVIFYFLIKKIKFIIYAFVGNF